MHLHCLNGWLKIYHFIFVRNIKKTPEILITSLKIHNKLITFFFHLIIYNPPLQFSFVLFIFIFWSSLGVVVLPDKMKIADWFYYNQIKMELLIFLLFFTQLFRNKSFLHFFMRFKWAFSFLSKKKDELKSLFKKKILYTV